MSYTSLNLRQAGRQWVFTVSSEPKPRSARSKRHLLIQETDLKGAWGLRITYLRDRVRCGHSTR